MKDLFGRVLVPVYIAGGPVTFSYLTFFDGYEYNSWNWIIVIPLNLILSGIWPIYWGILQWIPGLG